MSLGRGERVVTLSGVDRASMTCRAILDPATDPVSVPYIEEPIPYAKALVAETTSGPVCIGSCARSRVLHQDDFAGPTDWRTVPGPSSVTFGFDSTGEGAGVRRLATSAPSGSSVIYAVLDEIGENARLDEVYSLGGSAAVLFSARIRPHEQAHSAFGIGFGVIDIGVAGGFTYARIHGNLGDWSLRASVGTIMGAVSQSNPMPGEGFANDEWVWIDLAWVPGTLLMGGINGSGPYFVDRAGAIPDAGELSPIVWLFAEPSQTPWVDIDVIRLVEFEPIIEAAAQ